MTSSGFDAVAGPDARVLILGSLPGPASLERREYYAQPRNAFWRIMSELVGAEPTLPYPERLQILINARIALWDVCARAARAGGLDAAIQLESVEANDIPGFLGSHRAIRLICFNGAKAAELFRRCVEPEFRPGACAIPRLILPSTSPAHAAMRFEEKLRRWGSVAIHAAS